MDHVIPLIYDVTQRNWVTSVGGSVVQDPIEIGQMQSITFKVKFVKDGVQYALTTPTFSGGVKALNAVGAGYLLQFSTPTVSGSGATTVYEFELLIDSSQLRAFIASYLPSYLGFSYALEIRESFNNIATLPALSTKIYPDYTIVGTSPTTAVGTWNIAAGQTFTVNKTFAMPLDDGTAGFVLKTNGAGVGSWAVDSAGTGTVTNVAVTTANGVSGSVANPTTSAAITIALGAITPTTGAFSDATEATNSTTAPLKTAGGMAVEKKLFVGGIAEFSDNVDVNGELGVHDIRQIGGSALGFFDQGQNPTFKISPISASVNYVVVEPSITSSPPHIYAQGTDANIGLHLSPKGTGFVNIEDGTDTTKRLRFSASGNSTAVTTTLASSSTTSQTITLPNATTTLAGLAVTQSFTQVNTFSSSTASSSTTSGAVVITGGLGVGGNAYVGGVINIAATTSTAGQITQAGTRILHTFGGTGNIWLGLTTGNTAGALTGGNNVGIGTSAGKSITNGANNMLIGGNSGEFITTGYNNCCVGISSGYSIGAGILNVAIGYVALQFGGSGGYNTAIGQASLQNISTGTLNTCIGSDAGDDVTTVGGLTGANISSGASNTMIGALAASTSATGSFRTAIGSGSRCQTDNSIKLGRDTLDKVIIPSWSTAPTTSLSAGMLYYDTTLAKLRVYTTAWETITSV